MLLLGLRDGNVREGEGLMPIEQLLRQALRGKCCELAMFLHHGDLPELLLAEVAELATDVWALRDGDDA